MSRREWIILCSYFVLLLLFLVAVVIVSFVPPLMTAFSYWMGPHFALMGAHLIHFRKDHANIWRSWGGPSQQAFLMVGIFFLGIGVFFLVNAF